MVPKIYRDLSALGTFGALLEYSMEYFWGTFGVLWEYLWSTFRALLEYSLGNFGVLLEYFWVLSKYLTFSWHDLVNNA